MARNPIFMAMGFCEESPILDEGSLCKKVVILNKVVFVKKLVLGNKFFVDFVVYLHYINPTNRLQVGFQQLN